MAKFKPSHDVLDKENDNKELKAGEEVEMTIKRAEELGANITKQAGKNGVPGFYKDFKMERTDKPVENEKEPEKAEQDK